MRRGSLTEEGNPMFLLSPASGDAGRRPLGVLKEAGNELSIMAEQP